MPPVGECEGGPECRRKVDKLSESMFGGSHPERSLIVRVDQIERELRLIRKTTIATLLGVGGIVLRFAGIWLEALLK